ncbi:MAG: NUDIX hydrolase, partial [Caldilineaceae bacterium]|nr:NUDIX hydrolase [Caldilineaceae bacterium]
MSDTLLTVPAKPFAYQYPRPAVTVDIILFVFQQDQLRVLLIRRANDPYKGKWALPGGFVGEQENLYDAALRELKEETNVSNVYLEQLYTFGEPGRDPRARVITVAYFALLSAEEVAQQEVHGASDAGEAR